MVGYPEISFLNQDRVAVNRKVNKYRTTAFTLVFTPTGNLESPVNLTCMFLLLYEEDGVPEKISNNNYHLGYYFNPKDDLSLNLNKWFYD